MLMRVRSFCESCQWNQQRFNHHLLAPYLQQTKAQPEHERDGETRGHSSMQSGRDYDYTKRSRYKITPDGHCSAWYDHRTAPYPHKKQLVLSTSNGSPHSELQYCPIPGVKPAKKHGTARKKSVRPLSHQSSATSHSASYVTFFHTVDHAALCSCSR